MEPNDKKGYDFVIRIPKTKRYVGLCNESALCVEQADSKAAFAQKFSVSEIQINGAEPVLFHQIVALPSRRVVAADWRTNAPRLLDANFETTLPIKFPINFFGGLRAPFISWREDHLWLLRGKMRKMATYPCFSS